MSINAKVVIGGLLAACSLLAQPAGGPRGRWDLGLGPGGPGPGGREMRQTVTGAPYSAVEVRSTQQLLANGNVIQRQQPTNVFRDGQGRIRLESTRQLPNGQTETRVTISDPIAGVIHELDPANKISFDRPARFLNEAGANNRGQGRFQGRAAGNARLEANVKRETLAAQTINGVIATGSRLTRTIPAGTIGNTLAIEVVQETWMSDDLKVPVMTKVSDPRTGTTVTQLTNVNRSEPDAALFQVPAGYTVKTPPAGRQGPPRARGNRGAASQN